MLRFGIDVGADVDEDTRPAQRWHDGGDAGPANVLEEESQAQTAGHHGAGVTGADDGIHFALGQELPAAADGVIGLLAQGQHLPSLGVRPAAIPAHRVWQNGVAAAIAIRVLFALDVMMASPFPLPGMGDASLWNSHDSGPFAR